MPDLTTVFAGTPPFAAHVLSALVSSQFRPRAVYTQPDRPQGRGRRVAPGAVKSLAQDQGIEIEQPQTLRDDGAAATLRGYAPDVLIVVAYGLILPARILAVPRLGALNVHASLLPRWRGAAPIERAIMAGDTETGVSIMRMEATLDTGPVVARERIPIEEPANVIELETELAMAGSRCLLQTLEEWQECADRNQLPPHGEPQDHEAATYAAKLSNTDRKLDWRQDATVLSRQINALAARLPARSRLNDSGVQLLAARPATLASDTEPGIVIHADKTGIYIQCAYSVLQVTSLKLEQGKGSPLNASAAVNGYGRLFHAGARFAD